MLLESTPNALYSVSLIKNRRPTDAVNQKIDCAKMLRDAASRLYMILISIIRLGECSSGTGKEAR